MSTFRMPVQLRWSDFDANNHLRHSAYYDFGALARIAMLMQAGMDEKFFAEQRIGAVLLQESARFRREVRVSDTLEITAEILSCRPSGARWQIRHRLYKPGDILAAEIEVLGDWLDLRTRRLWHPTEAFTEQFMQLPRAEDFQFT